MNRLLLRKVLGVVVAVALSIGTTMPAQAAEQVTVKIWLLTENDASKAAYAQIKTSFEAANADIKIEFSHRSTDEHKTSMRNVAGTSAGPDLYFMWAGLGLGGEFVNSGVSQDLTKYYKQYNWSTRFNKSLLSHITQYGGFHGVPWTQRTEAIYYNKAAFKKAGITTLPKTYAQLLAANEKLVKAKITPMAFGGTVNWHLMRLLDNLIELKCGAKVANDLTSLKADWATTPCVTRAFTDLKLWTSKYINKSLMSVNNDAADTLFTTGKSAMQLEGDWYTGNIANFKLDSNDYGVFPFPTGTPRIYGFAEAIYMNVSSTHKDEAAKVLDYISSEAGQKILNPVMGGFSVNKSVKQTSVNNLDTDWIAINAAKTGVFINYDQAFPLAVTTEYWRIQNLVAIGTMKPSAAGKAMQSFITSNK
jgi:raffinose/stachyose/melibiose transport system substrate-binding protein